MNFRNHYLVIDIGSQADHIGIDNSEDDVGHVEQQRYACNEERHPLVLSHVPFLEGHTMRLLLALQEHAFGGARLFACVRHSVDAQGHRNPVINGISNRQFRIHVEAFDPASRLYEFGRYGV